MEEVNRLLHEAGVQTNALRLKKQIEIVRKRAVKRKAEEKDIQKALDADLGAEHATTKKFRVYAETGMKMAELINLLKQGVEEMEKGNLDLRRDMLQRQAELAERSPQTEYPILAVFTEGKVIKNTLVSEKGEAGAVAKNRKADRAATGRRRRK